MVKARTRVITMDEVLELTHGCTKKLKMSNGKEYRLIRVSGEGSYNEYEEVLEDAKGLKYGIRHDKCFPVY